MSSVGLADTDIFQIAAVRGSSDNDFVNLFLTPDVPEARRNIGHRHADRTVDPRGQTPDSCDNRNAQSLKRIMKKFCRFLKKTENNVLIGHNINRFDRPVLFHAMDKCDLLVTFCEQVKGKS